MSKIIYFTMICLVFGLTTANPGGPKGGAPKNGGNMGGGPMRGGPMEQGGHGGGRPFGPGGDSDEHFPLVVMVVKIDLGLH